MNRSELLELLKVLVENNDVKGIRKLIRREPGMHELSARELNEDFIINSHKFIKRHGVLSLISDHSRYPNSTNTVFLGSYQTRINNEVPAQNKDDSESISTINDNDSVSSRISDSDISCLSSMTSIKHLDNATNQRFDNERLDELSQQYNYLKEQFDAMSRNLINFINAYNNDLEPRVNQLEEIMNF